MKASVADVSSGIPDGLRWCFAVSRSTTLGWPSSFAVRGLARLVRRLVSEAASPGCCGRVHDFAGFDKLGGTHDHRLAATRIVENNIEGKRQVALCGERPHSGIADQPFDLQSFGAEDRVARRTRAFVPSLDDDDE